MRPEHLRFGIPKDAAERHAHRWLMEHSGSEGEGVMRSLAAAMRGYAEARFGKLVGSERLPGSCAFCGQFHGSDVCDAAREAARRGDDAERV